MAMIVLFHEAKIYEHFSDCERIYKQFQVWFNGKAWIMKGSEEEINKTFHWWFNAHNIVVTLAQLRCDGLISYIDEKEEEKIKNKRYIKKHFIDRSGGFVCKLKAFLKGKRALSIVSHHRDMLLGMIHIPNKYLNAMKTKNFDELSEYIKRFN